MTDGLTTFKVKSLKKVRWKELKFIQPPGFKDISGAQFESLKKSLKTKDYIDPIKVWEKIEATAIAEYKKEYYVLDGFHRVKAFHSLEEEGYMIPELVPVLVIECADEQDAANTVLYYSSEYAITTPQGVAALAEQYNLVVDDDLMESLDSDLRSILSDLDNIIKEKTKDININSDLIPRIPPTVTNLHPSANDGKEYLPDDDTIALETYMLLLTKEKANKLNNYLNILKKTYNEDNPSDLIFKVLEKEAQKSVKTKKGKD